MTSSKNSGAGWVVTRLISQESRGTTQVIASGSAPDCTSHTQVSMAVLPAPRTVKRCGSSPAPLLSVPLPVPRPDRALGGTTRTPGAPANDGVCVGGTVGLAYVASTTLRRTCTGVTAPDSSDRNRPSPSYSLIGW